MNTIAKFLFISAFSLSTGSFAGELPETSKSRLISQEVSGHLQESDLELNEDVTIEVVFIINRDREIIITEVRTDDDRLKRFITSRLNHQILQTEASIGKQYFLPVTFDVANG